jgi:hypothetical protein
MKKLTSCVAVLGFRAESEQSSGWFERLKHCTEVQLEAAESTTRPSKFVSDLPG